MALLSNVKVCEVCGGRVKQLPGKDSLWHCTKCGIVYFLDKASSKEMEPKIQDLRKKFSGERGDAQEMGEGAHSIEPAAEESTSKGHWLCPDCGTRSEFAEESDLEYIKREHFRGFHPNRMTS